MIDSLQALACRTCGMSATSRLQYASMYTDQYNRYATMKAMPKRVEETYISARRNRALA